jgi:hypothetical protein
LLSSSSSPTPRFFISLCNTAPLFTVHNESEWELMIRRDWLPALRHPSYLRVDGRLVFKVIDAPMFYQVGIMGGLRERMCGVEYKVW